MSILSKIKSSLGISHSISVTALMMIRNEEVHLEKCIHYLTEFGISVAVVDNESTDNSVPIIRSFIERGKPVRLYSHPFTGVFDLEQMLIKIEEVACKTKSDWFVLTSPDEILEAPIPLKNLYDGIAFVDKEGYNTINFDEFVFIPTNPAESFVGKDHEKEMKYYYFFEPRPNRLLRAWKNTGQQINLSKNASHKISFANQKVYPHNFVLKHYIFLSYRQGIKKYSSRVFAKRSIGKGWHSNRYNLTDTSIVLPSRDEMQFLGREREYVRSDPKRKHLFIKTSSTGGSGNDDHINLKDIELIPDPDLRHWTNAVPVVFLVSYCTASMQPFIPYLQDIPGSRVITGSTALRDFMVNDLKRWPDPEKRPELSNELLSLYCRKSGLTKKAALIIELSKDNGFLMPAIQKYIPAAKFIHVVQDIRTIIRVKGLQQEDKIVPEITGWIAYLKSVRQNMQYCNESIELRVEDFISDPARVMDKITALIGVGPDARDGGATAQLNEFYWTSGNDNISSEKLDDIAGYWRKEYGYRS